MPIWSAVDSQREDAVLLLEELAGGFRQALSLMTMREWPVQSCASAPNDSPGWLRWRQPFTGRAAGVVWIAASEEAWKQIAREIESAVGGGAGTQVDWKAQCAEVCSQASACLLRRYMDTKGEQASLSPGAFESANAESGQSIWRELADANGVLLPVHFGMTMPGESVADSGPANLTKHSASLDLLLEVELPVSVSFGRTRMKLKDAIRLSTGSIVELNKSLSEPVEIIVNNCVIARGEVVVVEGNYGVRIKEIVSREERLRTLF